MPPCAATVCDRVGNSLVMHACKSPRRKHPATNRSNFNARVPAAAASTPAPRATQPHSRRHLQPKQYPQTTRGKGWGARGVSGTPVRAPPRLTVLKPYSAKPMAARRPAPPAPTTTASYVWSTAHRSTRTQHAHKTCSGEHRGRGHGGGQPHGPAPRAGGGTTHKRAHPTHARRLRQPWGTPSAHRTHRWGTRTAWRACPMQSPPPAGQQACCGSAAPEARPSPSARAACRQVRPPHTHTRGRRTGQFAQPTAPPAQRPRHTRAPPWRFCQPATKIRILQPSASDAACTGAGGGCPKATRGHAWR
jgi:hypothetical protein